MENYTTRSLSYYEPIREYAAKKYKQIISVELCLVVN